MFSDVDVDIDERTEGSEWTITLNNTELKLDLVRFRKGVGEFKAVMYEPDEFVGTTWGYIDVPPIVTNKETFLRWGMYTIRREAAKRFIGQLTPQEFEMVFNLMNEQVNADFEAVIKWNTEHEDD